MINDNSFFYKINRNIYGNKDLIGPLPESIGNLTNLKEL